MFSRFPYGTRTAIVAVACAYGSRSESAIPQW